MKHKPKNYLAFRQPRNRAIRKLHNLYIATTLSVAALSDARKGIIVATTKKLTFDVPGTGGRFIRIQKRKGKVTRVLQKTIRRELYAQSLVSVVAVMEDYIATTIRWVLLEFPHKLLSSADGNPGERKIDLVSVIESCHRDEILRYVAEKRLGELLYLTPDKQFNYIDKVLGIRVPQRLRKSFAEIKATRDLLVHGSGRVNTIYLRKASGAARGPEGHELQVNIAYFESALDVIKGIIYSIYAQGVAKYGE